MLLAIASVSTLVLAAMGQAPIESNRTLDLAPTSTPGGTVDTPDLMYIRPGARTKLNSYLMNSIGPYSIVSTGLVAALDQADGTPPEWGQGAVAYGERFGSDLGIGIVSTTARYTLA